MLFLAFHVFSAGIHKGVEEEMATHSSILAYRNPMDGGVWRATVHGVAKSRTQLSDQARKGETWSVLLVVKPAQGLQGATVTASLPEDEDCLISEHWVQVTTPGHVLPGCAIFDFSLSSGGKGVWPLPLGVCGLYGQLGLCACLPSSL